MTSILLIASLAYLLPLASLQGSPVDPEQIDAITAERYIHYLEESGLGDLYYDSNMSGENREEQSLIIRTGLPGEYYYQARGEGGGAMCLLSCNDALGYYAYEQELLADPAVQQKGVESSQNMRLLAKRVAADTAQEFSVVQSMDPFLRTNLISFYLQKVEFVGLVSMKSGLPMQSATEILDDLSELVLVGESFQRVSHLYCDRVNVSFNPSIMSQAGNAAREIDFSKKPTDCTLQQAIFSPPIHTPIHHTLESIVMNLKTALADHVDVSHFRINQNLTIEPSDPLEISTLSKRSVADDSMGYLRHHLAQLSLFTLSSDPLLKDQLPELTQRPGNSLKIGADPLTRDRLASIIGLLESHKNPSNALAFDRLYISRSNSRLSLKSANEDELLGSFGVKARLHGINVLAHQAEDQAEERTHLDLQDIMKKEAFTRKKEASTTHKARLARDEAASEATAFFVQEAKSKEARAHDQAAIACAQAEKSIDREVRVIRCNEASARKDEALARCQESEAATPLIQEAKSKEATAYGQAAIAYGQSAESICSPIQEVRNKEALARKSEASARKKEAWIWELNSRVCKELRLSADLQELYRQAAIAYNQAATAHGEVAIAYGKAAESTNTDSREACYQEAENLKKVAQKLNEQAAQRHAELSARPYQASEWDDKG